MEVVPLPHAPLLPLDDRDALALQDEEALLRVLRVVHAVRLARVQDVHAEAEVGRGRGRRLERAEDAVALGRLPRDLGEVEDPPAGVGGDPAVLAVLDPRLLAHCSGA